MKTRMFIALIVGLSLTWVASAADGVLRVMVVQPTDIPAYVHEVEALQALYKKAGIDVRIRLWRATYAGPDTGTIVVSVQAANLGALSRLPEMIKANPELAAEMTKISSMRKIISDSLYEPLTD